VNAVQILFTGEAAGAVAAADETKAAILGVGETSAVSNAEMGKLERGVLAGSGAFRGLGRSIGLASGAFLLAGGFAEGLKSTIDESEKLEKAQDSLRAAIEHTGGDVAKQMPQYEATAKAAAEFGVSQADATQMQARALLLTGDNTKAQHAYQEALVISKATGKDFNSVLTATAKGQDGVTTSLQRYGITIKTGTSGQDQFTQVMGRFGDQARANTTNMDRLRANAANLGAEVGGPLLEGLNLVAGALSNLVGWIQKNSDLLKPLIVVIGAGAAAWGLYTLATNAYTIATTAATIAQEGLNLAMSLNPIGIVIVLIAALVAAFIEAWQNSQTFRDIVTGVWNDIKSAVLTVVTWFTQTVPAAFATVLDWFRNTWSEASALVSGVFTSLEHQAATGFGIPGDVQAAFGGARSWFSDKWGDVKGFVSAVFTDVEHDAESGFGVPGAITGAFGGARSWFSDKWGDVSGFVSGAFTSLIHDAEGGFGVVNAIQGAFGGGKGGLLAWLSSTFSGVGKMLAGLVVGPINAVIEAIDAIPFPDGVSIKTKSILGVPVPDGFSIDWTHLNIPLIPLATGGLVTRSTLAMLGEAGAEAVIPLTSPHAAPVMSQLAGQLLDALGGRGAGSAPLAGANIYVLGATERQVAAALKKIVDGAPATPGYAIAATGGV
jgi:hypothetical protein